MSAAYRAVNWNAHKKRYDAVVLAFVVLFVGGFVLTGSLAFRGEHAISGPVLMMRALGVCAIVMLHAVLAIGPLARLTTLAAPLLYNRRHLGVATFLVALAHAVLATLYYGSFGGRSPILVLLAMSGSGATPGAFPFVVPGFVALAVLFLMAATSHDFWLANLSPKWWKWLHMLVYAAYLLVLAHVTLGAMQSERSWVYPTLLMAGVAGLGSLHIAAGVRDRARDAKHDAGSEEWIDAGRVEDIPMDRAVAVRPPGRQMIAVYRHEGGISALHGVCAHQGGPLSEGRVIGGCVTCPWHGFQYRPEDGCAPPPYEDRLPTHRVRVEKGRVFVRIEAEAPGTRIEPAGVRDGR